MSADPSPPTGRRTLLREQATAQIKDAALEHVRQVGAADVSLRAVARSAGMSPAGLYRYYDGRDALLTALIADAFQRLAAAMDTASVAQTDPKSRLSAVAHAYRSWGVAHRHEFGLVFGNPVPGYAAPQDGQTTAAMRQVGQALMAPLVQLWLAKGLTIPAAFAKTEWDEPIGGLAAEIAALSKAESLPAEVAGYLLSVWARLHGLVSLEVFGQLDWVYPHGAEQLFAADLAVLLADMD